MKKSKENNSAENPGETKVATSEGGAGDNKRYHRRRGDMHEAEESSHVWLISFTDVMALMLTFFVLLFSMSVPTKENWSDITAAMNSEFNKFYGAVAQRGPQDSINIDRINFNRALNIGYLAALMDTVMADNELLKQATLTPQPGQLVISLPRDLLFEGGSASVREEGSRALYALGGSLSRIKNRIEIIGHADPRPVGETSEFESNWDLSLMRAANVAAILEKVGYESDITIRGHASGLYQDLRSVGDEEQRLALSRRVDIIVMDHDGNKNRVFLEKPAD